MPRLRLHDIEPMRPRHEHQARRYFRSYPTGDGIELDAEAQRSGRLSVSLAVTVALLRALRGRGLLTDGEIDDLFGEAAEHFRDAAALRLLNNVRAEVESKVDE
jgi:hypothetical protein